MRGATWVLDASNCQGCAAQFSLFTRKHHCQRCGGLFCSSCTQQRMVLRGQGDSPVRICDPCKKLEEAARYELRYGHKNRAGKASTKTASKPEDEILSELLGGDSVHGQLSHRESLGSEAPGRTVSTASASSSGSRKASVDGNGDGSLSTEAQNYELNNTASIFTPEELRQQAVEEKGKYKILKSEGKPEEALRAFKHGKELERQAAALELELRKSRRMATKAPIVSAVVGTQKIEDYDDAVTKKAPSGKRVRKEKNDLASELKDLGWSDADLHDETRPTAMSVEGELSQILREVAPKTSEGKKAGGIDKSQVNALKRQALVLKREGKLAEAKEELKKAKILERQLEEQEILGEAEESDDDLAAIIHNMDDDNQDDILYDNSRLPAINFEQILAVSDDLNFDGNFDVTDEDINDPAMAAALKSFGWSEDGDNQMDSHAPVSSLNREAVKEQVLALKREAVSHKKAGNVAEAMSLLKKAKLLEKDLETEQPESEVLFPGQKITHTEDIRVTEINTRRVSAPKSKLAIQRELLALKKKALALRREGKVDEAEEELKKGSILEKQLEELESSSNRSVARENMGFSSKSPLNAEPPSLDFADESYEPEVTDNDMQDPALLSVLKNMGWEDDDNDSVKTTDKPLNRLPIVAQKPKKNKGQIQKELLAIKRKALAFRREGKNTEAEEELEKAKVLEEQLAEIEELANSTASQKGSGPGEHRTMENKYDIQHVPNVHATASSIKHALKEDVLLPVNASELSASIDTVASSGSKPQTETVISQPTHNSKVTSDGAYSAFSRSPAADQLQTAEALHSPSDVDHKEPPKPHGGDTLRDDILLHKRKAVAFKREGKLAEAREELKLAKLLEKRLEAPQQDIEDGAHELTTSVVQQSNSIQQSASISTQTSPLTYAPPAQENKSVEPQKAMSSRDRLRIQRESLTHKRNALKLRREGKTAEADAEFELAKSLESQLEESDSQGSNSGGKSTEASDAFVEDLIDPQMMSALKSIGWSAADLSTQSPSLQPPVKAEARPTVAATSKAQTERSQLEEQIKAEKLKALTLKREGKQAEALEALRSAKRLEKKLASLS
ncbi:Ankyrin repeat and FYVE domain-containing protein 1 [Hordeum vulgare]|nr:Ankyrin repeat and FYVE domain-containing protein 1 [Hordeum vulgare]